MAGAQTGAYFWLRSFGSLGSQAYTDPRTNQIPNERPAWGSFQFVQAPWHNEPKYYLLITEGHMERLQLIITNILKRFYKYGEQIFERESSHCCHCHRNTCSIIKMQV